jgi:hypothetical protein
LQNRFQVMFGFGRRVLGCSLSGFPGFDPLSGRGSHECLTRLS